jgi:hypothetical protein
MLRKLLTSAVVAAACGLLGSASIVCAADAPCCTGPAAVQGCPAPCEQGCPTCAACPTCDKHHKHHKKVCIPVDDTKQVVKRTYGQECEDFCLPCSILGSLLHRKCDCSKPCHRKYLMIKICKRDECVKKCIPVDKEPCCPAPCDGCCAAAPCGQSATVTEAPLATHNPSATPAPAATYSPPTPYSPPTTYGTPLPREGSSLPASSPGTPAPISVPPLELRSMPKNK